LLLVGEKSYVVERGHLDAVISLVFSKHLFDAIPRLRNGTATLIIPIQLVVSTRNSIAKVLG
jgi:hypothetical protein